MTLSIVEVREDDLESNKDGHSIPSWKHFCIAERHDLQCGMECRVVIVSYVGRWIGKERRQSLLSKDVS